ncbi:superoxide dismutase family protein [Clostridium sp. 19966]|uniref:superoxide dismutase family protein n=1 Tax=Clostridium sp. 19966 TaxID=2768166 RepID=UPI0028DF5B3F|nr:superoxide dismutase family protein [Clostridium sp. 19966]MDT8718771.1 superoxide dismutase family protein [Clostridium sp. 19966]
MYFDDYQCPFYRDYCGYRNSDMYMHNRRAAAYITGGPLAPNIRGTVLFTEVPGGIEVSAEINGLPQYKPAVGENPQIGPHGFHIHQGTSCIGNTDKPFMSAGEHWNPTNEPHVNHSGDFPVLFSNDGYSRMTFFTNKFSIPQIIGKTIIIHESPDDYRTQPSGASGKRLACGVIQEML